MRADAISGIAAKLTDEYSRDPCYIARSLGIIVNFEPLYRLNGFYNTAYRQKFIHINSQLSHRAQRFVCAHELGHAILHPDNNTHFLRNHTLYPISRYEKEATYFASCLLISDDDLNEYRHFTYEQLGKVFGVDEKIVRIRVEGI